MSNQRAGLNLEGKKDYLLGMVAGVAAGFILSFLLPDPKPTLEEMEIEFDAMRMCMQTAGKTRCHMTIEDFIRYHELKELLNEPDQ